MEGVSGRWRDMVESLNHMGRELTMEVRLTSQTAHAWAAGDTSPRLDRQGIAGEFAEMQQRLHAAADRWAAATSIHEKVGPGWFIPPEAEHGRTDPDCAHDVYMLGKVLYYTLTGGHRFPRERFADGDANIESMFGRPDFAVINELFDRMIIEDPPKRFQSMEAVVAAIDATLGRLFGRRSMEQEAQLDSRLTGISDDVSKLEAWQRKAEVDLETAFQSFGEMYLHGHAPHRKAPTRQG